MPRDLGRYSELVVLGNRQSRKDDLDEVRLSYTSATDLDAPLTSSVSEMENGNEDDRIKENEENEVKKEENKMKQEENERKSCWQWYTSTRFYEICKQYWFIIGIFLVLALAKAYPPLGETSGLIYAQYSLKIPAIVTIFLIQGKKLRKKRKNKKEKDASTLFSSIFPV